MSNPWITISDSALRYWHPVCKTSRLGAKPLGIRLCNQDIVLFRTTSGRVGAVEDRCAHRCMRLSLGEVAGERIVCPYHSWSYGCNGEGVAPAEPDKSIQIQHFDVKEAMGYFWIRRDEGVPVDFPVIEFPGFSFVHAMSHEVNAPFRLLMDNMAELEHTTSVHDNFGFSLRDIRDVVTDVHVDDNLKIYYEGPQRAVPAYLTLGTGIRGGDHYVQHAEVRFGPVYSTYDLYWHHVGTRKRRKFALKFVIFYNPVTEHRCEQHAFVYIDDIFPRWILALIRPLLVRTVEREILSDIRLVESLREADADASRHNLGKFDRPLEIAREFIRSKYFLLEG